MSTPHIDAPDGAFAPTVLFPGDPLRAQHIAQRFLTDAMLVTSARNMFGYTGDYRGQRISVMGSGMGIASSSIYATELIRHYGVRRIVRVGTCGAVSDDLDLGDLVLAEAARRLGAVTRMSDVIVRYGGEEFTVIMPGARLEDAQRVAERIRLHVAGSPFRVAGGRELLTVTISVGVATTLGEEDSPDALLKRADEAVYEAKAAGRNRVIARAA